MCQLILANTHNKIMNRLLYFILSLKDSDTGNKDGFGYTTGDRVFCSDKTPFTAGIATIIQNSSISTKPVAGHVRSASFVVGKERMLGAEFSHPFISDDYILMHNGTLEFIDIEYAKKYKDARLIDSQMFLLELQESTTKNPLLTLSDHMKETMKKFRGKFAFIIYEKATATFYAIRGKTADLHYAKVIVNKKPGIVINTAMKELKDTLSYATELCKIFNIELSYEEPQLIKPETINVLTDDEIIEVSDITENARPVAITTWFSDGDYEEGESWVGGSRYTQRRAEKKQPSDSTNNNIHKLSKFMSGNGIPPSELDEIWYHLYGNGLLNITEKQLELFVEKAIPTFNKRRSHNQYVYYERLQTKLKTSNLREFFSKSKLQFPYILNDVQTLKKELEK
jgi:predicted glutamine amidotransferase